MDHLLGTVKRSIRTHFATRVRQNLREGEQYCLAGMDVNITLFEYSIRENRQTVKEQGMCIIDKSSLFLYNLPSAAICATVGRA